MSDQQGLRFDIFERVPLTREIRGLDQLEQLELQPYIQALTQGEQAVLRGHLLLTAVFDGSGEYRGERIEHLIPVEITLPMSRIPDLENVSVTIDNFDVDVLSPNALNVTGVLCLHGVDIPSTDETWRSEPAEKTIVTETKEQEPAQEQVQAPAPAKEIPAPPSVQLPVTPLNVQLPEDLPLPTTAKNEPANIGPANIEPANIAPANIGPANFAPVNVGPANIGPANIGPANIGPANIAPANVAPVNDGPANVSPFDANMPGNVSPITAESANFAPFHEHANEHASFAPLANADNLAPPVATEPKVAFKPSAEPNHTTSALQQFLHKTPSPPAITEAELKNAEHPPEPAAKPDKLEWKKLFLRDDQDQRFTAVRMCIVQRSDTLETIAERYNIQAREIALYNRLSEPAVNEGQVICIPRPKK